MAKRLTDEEQNLRRKARRRLIGAIALTLVVVVVLPMVLDREPKPAGHDIELRIPDRDKSGEFVPGVAAPEPALSSVSAGSAVAASSTMAASADNVAAVPPASTVKPVAPSVKVKPDVKNPERPKAAEKPAGAVTEKFVVQIGAYSNAVTAKQELGKLKKWGFRAYTEKAGDKIRVRVGPYAGREKAEKARQLLEKHGLKPEVMGAK